MGTDRHDSVDHTLEAVTRLRRLLSEHERSGDADSPFFMGIREALVDLDARVDREESSAA